MLWDVDNIVTKRVVTFDRTHPLHLLFLLPFLLLPSLPALLLFSSFLSSSSSSSSSSPPTSTSFQTILQYVNVRAENRRQLLEFQDKLDTSALEKASHPIAQLFKVQFILCFILSSCLYFVLLGVCVIWLIIRDRRVYASQLQLSFITAVGY